MINDTILKSVTVKRPKASLLVMLILLITTWICALQATAQRASTAVLRGVVLSAEDGKPVVGATVFILASVMQTSTDAHGHYALSGIKEGTIRVGVRVLGYRSDEAKVTVKAGVSCHQDFALHKDAVALDEVVVSADRSLVLRRESSNLVDVLDSKLLEVTHSSDLCQGLNFRPGVRTEDNCRNCGFTQVRINGLDGHYSQILIDSRPVFSALQGIYGLEQIPANMIERVEVLRGGGSALYGASAIAGTINVVTKEPLRNAVELSHDLMTLGKGCMQNTTTANASVISPDNKIGIYVYGARRSRGRYDRDGDGYTELPALKNQVMGLNIGYRINAYNRLQVKYHGIKEFRRGGDLPQMPPHQAHIAEQLSHDIDGGSLNLDHYSPSGRYHTDAYLAIERVKRDSYYGGIGAGEPEDVEAAARSYGLTRSLNLMGGVRQTCRWDKLLFMPAELIGGLEMMMDEVNDHSLGTDYRLKQTARTAAAFIQNEWKDQHCGILVGGRIDKHNMLERPIFTPRVNFRFSPDKETIMRLTYASGFRAPQTFDEDLHTGFAGGELIRIRLAKGLKAERSHSISLSCDHYMNWDDWSANLLVEGFYTRLCDAFAMRATERHDDYGYVIHERYNADGATVSGCNVEGRAGWRNFWDLQAGITAQRSFYDKFQQWSEEVGGERRIMRTPDVYGYFTTTIRPLRGLSLSFSGNYTGRMLVPHTAGSGTDQDVNVKTPAFMTLGVKAVYTRQITQGHELEVALGAQNITDAFQRDTDKGYERDAAYVYGPSMPRCVFVGLKLR